MKVRNLAIIAFAVLASSIVGQNPPGTKPVPDGEWILETINGARIAVDTGKLWSFQTTFPQGNVGQVTIPGPLSLQIIARDSAGPYNNITHTFSAECFQTHRYVNGILVSHNRAVQSLAVSDVLYSTTNFNQDLLTLWATAVAQQADKTYQSGTFKWVLKVTRQSTVLWTRELEFKIPDGYSWKPPGQDPGGANSPDPEVQRGFWEDLMRRLFVPSQASIQDLKDTLYQWSQWGPFGVFNALNNRMLGYSDTVQAAPEYKIGVWIPFFGNNEAAIDLSPYGDTIAFIRLLLVGMIWVVGTILMGRRVADRI